MTSKQPQNSSFTNPLLIYQNKIEKEEEKEIEKVNNTIKLGCRPTDVEKSMEDDYIRQRQNEEINRLQIENESLRDNLNKRKELTKYIFIFSISWVIFICVMYVLAGLKTTYPVHIPFLGWEWPFAFHWSDKVIIALLVNTTVTIIGLFSVVIKYFFSTNK